MEHTAASLNRQGLLFPLSIYFHLISRCFHTLVRNDRTSCVLTHHHPPSPPVFRVMTITWLHVGENLFVYIHTILRVVLRGGGEVWLLLERAVNPVLLNHHVLALAE